ncbi:LysM peptidoglycan-binding domain-containing protein [Neobacillus sp. YIM B02564]|uniref:LysM peptidoglycan-binding domain-containing protein n=1 Tax=Neobacillus paridis TaxID=2803862 RepID=A0ABS1TLV3_9BACI|nr:LysM domain-containing protein [Neobacillus paridis]MBL4952158.1 LysM peptidoglycan-binding domain-containing protein [Neobacillus paridis]
MFKISTKLFLVFTLIFSLLSFSGFEERTYAKTSSSYSTVNYYVMYKVKHGDTLSKIAKKFKVSLTALKKSNPKYAKKKVRAGVTIKIPKQKKVLVKPTKKEPEKKQPTKKPSNKTSEKKPVSGPSSTFKNPSKFNVNNVVCFKGKVEAYYINKQNVAFVSCTPTWTKSKLMALDADFQGNAIGEEITALSMVVLTSYSPSQAGDITLSFEEEKGRPTKLIGNRVINLYNADVNDQVVNMAFTLSHEYGHLFTTYWLAKKERRYAEDRTNGWAKARMLSAYPVLWSDVKRSWTHYWDPSEIMADDYAHLFGSPVARKNIQYVDQMKPFDVSLSGVIENQQIPSVESTKIREYWTKLAGLKISNPTPLKAPEITGITPFTVYGITLYKIQFTPVHNSNHPTVQYFAKWSDQTEPDAAYSSSQTPIVKNQSSVSFEAKDEGEYVVTPAMPEGKAAIRVYAYDPNTKQFTYSEAKWFDFSNPNKPVAIKNQFKY